MNYYGKDHLHKPKKGKGSYERDTLSVLEAALDDMEEGLFYETEFAEEPEQCSVNTTTADGATHRKKSSQRVKKGRATSPRRARKRSTNRDETQYLTYSITDLTSSGLNQTSLL